MAPLKPHFAGETPEDLARSWGVPAVRGHWQACLLPEQNSGVWAPCEDRTGPCACLRAV